MLIMVVLGCHHLIQTAGFGIEAKKALRYGK